MVKRKGAVCEYGCIGTFRSEWDYRQHKLYAHEHENGATTLRSINEAVRGIGRPNPVDAHSLSATTKREGDWTFIPRSSRSVPQSDHQSTKSASSTIWRGGLTRVLSITKRPPVPPRPVISNPIPHPRSLETAERIGVDLEIARYHHQLPSGSNLLPNALVENPIALEDKDFESESEPGSDYSLPSSPSDQISTPQDVPRSLPVDDLGNKKSLRMVQSRPELRVLMPPNTHMQARPPLPRSPGSFSRPTPAAYPLLLRQSSTSQVDFIASPISPSTPKTAPARPPRPPLPTRSPARTTRATHSEDGHGAPTSYKPPNSAGWMRKSPSHGVLRI